MWNGKYKTIKCFSTSNKIHIFPTGAYKSRMQQLCIRVHEALISLHTESKHLQVQFMFKSKSCTPSKDLLRGSIALDTNEPIWFEMYCNFKSQNRSKIKEPETNTKLKQKQRIKNRLNCTLASSMQYIPNAWHCKIFVRPSPTIEPDDDGCVVNLGGWICCDESTIWNEKKNDEKQLN